QYLDCLFRTAKCLFRIVANVRKDNDRRFNDISVLAEQLNRNGLSKLVRGIVEDDVVSSFRAFTVELYVLRILVTDVCQNQVIGRSGCKSLQLRNRCNECNLHTLLSSLIFSTA